MPSSEIIPRERLSAWQRWELGSLAAVPSKAETDRMAADVLATQCAQALAEARAAGYAEGRALASAEQKQLAALASSLSHCVAEHEQRLVDEVLDLALLLARQMVGEALAVKRELLLPVVSAALRQLPQTTQRIDILVHPSDLPTVQHYIATEPLGERCHFIAHPTMGPGGCRIETEQCEIDATVGSRWKRLLASLGRTGDWIEPA
jgi:flagellar assembly protein FliH